MARASIRTISTCRVGKTGIFVLFQQNNQDQLRIEHVDRNPAQQVSYKAGLAKKEMAADFTDIADQVMDAVVHIKSTSTYTNSAPMPRTPNQPFFRDFFDQDLRYFFDPQGQGRAPQRNDQPQVKMGQGSGVIISDDGYIVTNRHLIAEADHLEVILQWLWFCSTFQYCQQGRRSLNYLRYRSWFCANTGRTARWRSG